MSRAVICPTVTAFDAETYRKQLAVASELTSRIHIDLMDGEFAPTKSPELGDIWWPHHVKAEVHLMYQRPMEQLEALIHLQPNMVIVHAEADVHHMHLAGELHAAGIKAGLAITQDTPPENIFQIMHSFDQILIFSGNLGHHGGSADIALLEKVKKISDLEPTAEIAWDGGVNELNAALLVEGGVDVLNVGGFIQGAHDPKAAYAKLKEIIRK